MADNIYSPLRVIAEKIKAANAEIDKIREDANRRAAPFVAQIERLQIAADVWREIDAPTTASVSDTVIATDAASATVVRGKTSARTMISEELKASALPLSKAELVDRFVARGDTVNDTTIGSTLSHMVRDGILMKAGPSRYTLKSAASAIGARTS